MKNAILLILTLALLLTCPLARASEGAEGAHETPPEIVARYTGTWTSGDFVLELRYVDGDFQCGAMKPIGGDERTVWEYDVGWYDAALDAVLCVSASCSKQRYDPSTKQYRETDWALDDMTPATFTLGEDGDTLVVSGLLRVDKPLTLKRQDPTDAD